jgi:oligopeptide transport system permease protein
MSNAAVAASNVSASAVQPQHLSPNQRAWRRFRRNRPAMLSLAFMGVLLLAILFFPTQPPTKGTDRQFSPPTAQHWFGTDIHGRDIFARVLSGGRVSLLVGAVGASVSLVIGVLWGAIAGYIGGRVDSVMMRVVDVLYSLPTVIFVIVLVALLNGFISSARQGSFISENETLLRLLLLFVGIGAVSWLTMSRIVRGQVLSLKNRQFIDATRALGASHARILLKHILPNVAGVILVYLTLTVPSVILYESFLSFLGMGIQPPMASWGSLIAEGARQLNPLRIYWWLLVFPCAMLITTLIALNFIGDGLRDAFDPRGDRA